MVLRGASAPNAYIGYAPVTNAEYAMFKSGFTYDKGKENYPVVNITIDEAEAYCNWLTAQDREHIYRLPSEEEWILGAGHMPKDVAMNANRIESGLTAVDAYKQSAVPAEASTSGATAGSGLPRRMLLVRILSKGAVGIPNATIAAARNRMM